MTMKNKIAGLKPYLGGAAVGAVAVIVLGFGSGFVVQTSTMNENVENAKVSILAEVCQQNALVHWQEQGRETDGLRGWRNEERTQLATQFAPTLGDGESIRQAVINSCDRLLRSA